MQKKKAKAPPDKDQFLFPLSVYMFYDQGHLKHATFVWKTQKYFAQAIFLSSLRVLKRTGKKHNRLHKSRRHRKILIENGSSDSLSPFSFIIAFLNCCFVPSTEYE